MGRNTKPSGGKRQVRKRKAEKKALADPLYRNRVVPVRLNKIKERILKNESTDDKD